MSRICGIIKPGLTPDHGPALLQRLIAPMLHSSDFTPETWCKYGVAFGRIFFKNLNFSTHAYHSTDNQVYCAFCGYLRDRAALGRRMNREDKGIDESRSPAEIVAHLMVSHGASFLKELCGSFVFAHWDARSATISLGTDRFGVIPLYYSHSGAQLIFASEIKSILNLIPDQTVNFSAFQEILALGHPLAAKTVYSSIHRLPPASIVTFQAGKLETKRYWWYDQLPAPPKVSVTEFVDTAQNLLNRSIGALMEQIDAPVCMLSAGYDSRRIFLELVRHPKSIRAFTAPIVHSDGRFVCDVLIARALCRRFNVQHFASKLPPNSDAGRIARLTSRLLDFETGSHAWALPLISSIPVACGVNFDGLGGDILFESNFVYEAEAAHSDDPAWLASAVLARFPDLWSSHFRKSVDATPIVERIEQIIRQIPVFDHRYTLFYLTNWSRRMTSTMTNGLLSLKIDSVFPYLDYDLVDFLFSIPPLTKRHSEVTKLMLNTRDQKLADTIPTSHYPGIYSNPDYHCRPFCEALPLNYFRSNQTDLYRSAAAGALATRGVFGELSRHAQSAALAFALTQRMSSVPQWVLDRSWPLTGVGQFAHVRRTIEDPNWAAESLEQARNYLFSMNAACTL